MDRDQSEREVLTPLRQEVRERKENMLQLTVCLLCHRSDGHHRRRPRESGRRGQAALHPLSAVSLGCRVTSCFSRRSQEDAGFVCVFQVKDRKFSSCCFQGQTYFPIPLLASRSRCSLRLHSGAAFTGVLDGGADPNIRSLDTERVCF